ncbi:MAG TPA: thrombospondin type 3 repeat-containing protein [Sandaracinaceae bacterium LLY-WYZ-13_1]|nr:thrombospondin type 3 repeat-containing protein [Sandaracinaceae bacterium LLY-WYZ-13_1]
MSARVVLLVTPLLMTACFVERTGVRDPDDAGGQTPDADPLDAGRPDAGPPDAGVDGGPDRDGDGVPDAVDLCPEVADPDQEDLDEDGRGDACDDDRDGDLLVDALDLCPERDSRGSPDEDGDGIIDECDACPLDPDPGQANADGDRLGDACEDVDPTRFSRVAYLETFAGSLGDLTPAGSSIRVVDGSVELASEPEASLTRPRDDDHPGNRYLVHAVGRYLGIQGAAGAGRLGVFLRWTLAAGGRFGYRMEVVAEEDRVVLSRHDGGGCGPSGTDECVETLIDRELGLRLTTERDFALRAIAYDDRLSLEIENADGDTSHVVHDVRHSVGGLGLHVREARVRFHALAVYAP